MTERAEQTLDDVDEFQSPVGFDSTGGTDAPGDDADDDEPDSLAEAIRRVKENDT